MGHKLCTQYPVWMHALVMRAACKPMIFNAKLCIQYILSFVARTSSACSLAAPWFPMYKLCTQYPVWMHALVMRAACKPMIFDAKLCIQYIPSFDARTSSACNLADPWFPMHKLCTIPSLDARTSYACSLQAHVFRCH